MSAEIYRAVSTERALGAELAKAAEALLAQSEPEPLEPTLAVQVAIADLLLTLYWELRHEHTDTPSIGTNVVSIDSRRRRRTYRRPPASDPGA
jgi:hypothetical protein